MQSVIVSTFSIRRKGGENFIGLCLRSIGRALYDCVYPITATFLHPAPSEENRKKKLEET